MIAENLFQLVEKVYRTWFQPIKPIQSCPIQGRWEQQAFAFIGWCPDLILLFLNPIDFLKEEADCRIGMREVGPEGFCRLGAGWEATLVSLCLVARRRTFLPPIVPSGQSGCRRLA
ncbi:unnamed protein product [Prunus armeniaca]